MTNKTAKTRRAHQTNSRTCRRARRSNRRRRQPIVASRRSSSPTPLARRPVGRETSQIQVTLALPQLVASRRRRDRSRSSFRSVRLLAWRPFWQICSSWRSIWRCFVWPDIWCGPMGIGSNQPGGSSGTKYGNSGIAGLAGHPAVPRNRLARWQRRRVKAHRFADFADPFATGTASRYSAAQLVQYSFEALEAWAREHGCPRQPDQTAYEFAQHLAAHRQNLEQGARQLAALYSAPPTHRAALPWRACSRCRASGASCGASHSSRDGITQQNEMLFCDSIRSAWQRRQQTCPRALCVSCTCAAFALPPARACCHPRSSRCGPELRSQAWCFRE